MPLTRIVWWPSKAINSLSSLKIVSVSLKISGGDCLEIEVF
jgi:hypothetical protein